MEYLIASVKHTTKDTPHIIWWRPDSRGYTPVIDRAGRYTAEEAAKLNDGIDVIAVKASVVGHFSRPTPYYKPACKYYDHEGPVVQNIVQNWNGLRISRLEEGRREEKFKCTPFRKKSTLVYGNGGMYASAVD